MGWSMGVEWIVVCPSLYVSYLPSITIKLGKRFTRLFCVKEAGRARGVLFCMFINHKEICSQELADSTGKYQTGE